MVHHPNQFLNMTLLISRKHFHSGFLDLNIFLICEEKMHKIFSFEYEVSTVAVTVEGRGGTEHLSTSHADWRALTGIQTHGCLTQC